MARLRSIIACLGALALSGAAYSPASQFEVDLELVLAVDVSMSMNADELALQRQGYLDALSNPQVIEAMLTTGSGRVALAYMEWAGADHSRFVVPWRLIDSVESAEAFVGELARNEPKQVDRTSISTALSRAGHALEHNAWRGLRRIIDVSGDGPNNEGEALPGPRDRLVDMGIVINGLTLQVEGAPIGLGIENLDEYYRACVTGGSGSFVLVVRSWAEFSRALQLKLLQEITGVPAGRPALHHAAYDPIQGPKPAQSQEVDCLIGEKIHEKFMRMYNVLD